jgi:hypothetical protein
VGSDIPDGGLFIISHEPAVSDDICTENGGEFTLKTFVCHKVTPCG